MKETIVSSGQVRLWHELSPYLPQLRGFIHFSILLLPRDSHCDPCDAFVIFFHEYFS